MTEVGEIVKLVGGVLAIIGSLLAAGIFIGRLLFGAGTKTATVEASVQAVSAATQGALAVFRAEINGKIDALNAIVVALGKQLEKYERAQEVDRKSADEDADRLTRIESLVSQHGDEIKSIRRDRHDLANEVAKVSGWVQLEQRRRGQAPTPPALTARKSDPEDGQ